MSNTDEEMAALYKGRAEGREYEVLKPLPLPFPAGVLGGAKYLPFGDGDFNRYEIYREIQRPETLEEGWERLTKGCNYSLREWSCLEEGFHIGAKWAAENNYKEETE